MNLEQTTAKPNAKAADGRGAEFAQEAFPGVRYFQIHFEHIESLIAELRASLEQVRGELAELRAIAGGVEGDQTSGKLVMCAEEATSQQRSN
jgi:transposase